MCVYPRIQPVCNGATISQAELDGMRFTAAHVDAEGDAEEAADDGDIDTAHDDVSSEDAALVEVAAGHGLEEDRALLRSNDHGRRLRTHAGLHHGTHVGVDPPPHIGSLPNERWVRVRLSPYHGVKEVKDINVQPFVWIKRRYELPLLPDGSPNYEVTSVLPTKDE